MGGVGGVVWVEPGGPVTRCGRGVGGACDVILAACGRGPGVVWVEPGRGLCRGVGGVWTGPG